MNITIHVIDSTTGKGAMSLPVTLEVYAGHGNGKSAEPRRPVWKGEPEDFFLRGRAS